ncbi:MAG: hypothetical protein EXS37_15915 [Opitutus sp.]|nr:hypothetical protein [Opitutus sp.]
MSPIHRRFLRPLARIGDTLVAALVLAATLPAPTVAQGQPLPRWSDQKLRGTGGPPLAFSVEPAFPRLGLGGLTTIRVAPAAFESEAERGPERVRFRIVIFPSGVPSAKSK